MRANSFSNWKKKNFLTELFEGEEMMHARLAEIPRLLFENLILRLKRQDLINMKDQITAVKLKVKPSEPYPAFCSMKRLGVFLIPLDGMLVHRR